METIINKITLNLRVARSTIKWWSIVAVLLFIANLTTSALSDNDLSTLIAVPTVYTLIAALTYLIRILIIYVVLSLIPIAWITKALCFISTAVVFSGIGSIIINFSLNNIGGSLIKIIFNLSYIVLIYMVATVSIQTIHGIKFQSDRSYLAKWSNAFKITLHSHWHQLIIAMIIYFVLLTIIQVPLTNF